MEFFTKVDIPRAVRLIDPCDNILCLGSCFAERVGTKMSDAGLNVTVNPWGTLYNPASVADALGGRLYDEDTSTIRMLHGEPGKPLVLTSPKGGWTTLIVTLGTSHVYERDGHVVANCRKRKASEFTERELSHEEIVAYLRSIVTFARHVIFTVSPYRYAKYGFHESCLAKARLLIAVDQIVNENISASNGHRVVEYFPAYEIMMDELRDYRYYAADMLHPSEVAVDYIWQRFCKVHLSAETLSFIDEMRPVQQFLAHRPFNPDGNEYKSALEQTMEKKNKILKKYNLLT